MVFEDDKNIGHIVRETPVERAVPSGASSRFLPTKVLWYNRPTLMKVTINEPR